MDEIKELVAALRNQRQIDKDGTEVAVSRQAVDEAADLIDKHGAIIASQILWCMHILGPDDMHPAPSLAHARRAADLFNARFGQISEASDVMCKAVVAPWPHSAESHAESVDKFIVGWIVPQSLTSASAATLIDEGGKTASAQPCVPVIDWPAIQATITECVADYEMIGEAECGRDGVYNPTETERALIEDAIHGLLADTEFLNALRPTPPAAKQAQQEKLAAAIHYPVCWDTAAYPTLESALDEVSTSFQCANEDTHPAQQDADIGRPDGWTPAEEIACARFVNAAWNEPWFDGLRGNQWRHAFRIMRKHQDAEKVDAQPITLDEARRIAREARNQCGPSDTLGSAAYVMAGANAAVAKAAQPDPAMAGDFPLGAIENGRAFAERLEADYSFECEAGRLQECTDWQEFRRCFEFLAEWALAMRVQPASGEDASKTKAIHAAGSALSNAAFNLAQRAGEVLTSDYCQSLDDARKAWDAAVSMQQGGQS